MEWLRGFQGHQLCRSIFELPVKREDLFDKEHGLNVSTKRFSASLGLAEVVIVRRKGFRMNSGWIVGCIVDVAERLI